MHGTMSIAQISKGHYFALFADKSYPNPVYERTFLIDKCLGIVLLLYLAGGGLGGIIAAGEAALSFFPEFSTLDI